MSSRSDSQHMHRSMSTRASHHRTLSSTRKRKPHLSMYFILLYYNITHLPRQSRNQEQSVFYISSSLVDSDLYNRDTACKYRYRRHLQVDFRKRNFIASSVHSYFRLLRLLNIRLLRGTIREIATLYTIRRALRDNAFFLRGYQGGAGGVSTRK